MSGPFSSAFISEAVSRTTSLLTGKYSEHNNVQEWIDRLVMARIQIESTLLESKEFFFLISESKEFDINNDEPLHKWQEKLKEVLCEAEEVLSNFPAEILHEEPNLTIEGGHTASNLGEAVSRQVDLQANLPHDPLMQEQRSDDATLVHTASNLTEAVTRQLDQQANLPYDPFLQEQGSDDATLVHTASNLTEAVTRQLDQQANLSYDPFLQEQGSDDATLVHTVSNLTEVVTRQVDLEANLPHDPIMQEERSDDATLVHTVSNLPEAVIWRNFLRRQSVEEHTHHFFQEANLLINLRFSPVLLRQLMSDLYENFLRPVKQILDDFNSPLQDREWSIAKALKYCLILRTDHPWKKRLVEYLENDKNVSKLKNTVEKLEKEAGKLGVFIELLKLQKKRKLNRKRKRSGVALLGFFLVISHKLQTYALFCYREDLYLLVIEMFRANCTVPTAITGDFYIGFIM